MTKKILFLTGTRADFGKLKSLIQKTAIIAQALQKLMIDGYTLCMRESLLKQKPNKPLEDFLPIGQ